MAWKNFEEFIGFVSKMCTKDSIQNMWYSSVIIEEKIFEFIAV